MTSTCEPYRDALSALADGEVAPVGRDALRGHLEACDRCTAFAAATDDLARRVRVAPAEPVPDLTASILAAVETPDVARERSRFAQLRGLLAVVGVLQLVLAVPALLASGDLATHVTRESGIFEVALGVGFLLAARRPQRASGLLPVAAMVAALVTVTSLGDVLAGSTSLVRETVHLLQLVGTGLLWALDRRRGRATLAPVHT
jgi:predicted anti-sigma-YlaC factor YlaD